MALTHPKTGVFGQPLFFFTKTTSMRIVLQRVSSGRVTVNGQTVAEIGRGFVILLGIGPADTHKQACFLAEKIANLRIFEDDLGKMNLSIRDVHGQALVVSQFTLYADTRKGRRPSFTDAAPPDLARPLVDFFAQQLNNLGVPTQTGEFGAHMLVAIHNDGPVTIMFEADSS
jgi:D-tyrosyl-tRNA(Tyr) deacylase